MSASHNCIWPREGGAPWCFLHAGHVNINNLSTGIKRSVFDVISVEVAAQFRFLLSDPTNLTPTGVFYIVFRCKNRISCCKLLTNQKDHWYKCKNKFKWFEVSTLAVKKDSASMARVETSGS